MKMPRNNKNSFYTTCSLSILYAMNHYSMTDYFICSPEMVLLKHHVMILNDGDNLSDHLAIIRKFAYGKVTAHYYSIPKSKVDYGYKLQWEKADVMCYQSYLNSQLNNVIGNMSP